MLAIVAGHKEVARLLAKAGADLSLRGTGAPGFADKTAFDLAVVAAIGVIRQKMTQQKTAKANEVNG